MPDAHTRRARSRRLRWLLLGLAGCAGVAFAAVWLARLLPAYFHQSLNKQVGQSGVVSMFIGAATLLVSVIALVVAVRQGRRAADLSPDERRELEARDRLRQHLGRQDQLPRVGDPAARALALGVHQAIPPDSLRRRPGRR